MFTLLPAPDHLLVLCLSGSMRFRGLPLACSLSHTPENCHPITAQVGSHGDPPPGSCTIGPARQQAAADTSRVLNQAHLSGPWNHGLCFPLSTPPPNPQVPFFSSPQIKPFDTRSVTYVQKTDLNVKSNWKNP